MLNISHAWALGNMEYGEYETCQFFLSFRVFCSQNKQNLMNLLVLKNSFLIKN